MLLASYPSVSKKLKNPGRRGLNVTHIIVLGVSLPNIRKLGYDSMETWFGQGVLGLGVDIETMERDFKSWFGDTLMSSIKHPKCVLIISYSN